VVSARNFEALKAQQQEALMQQNRLLADRAYENEIAQLNARMMQEQEAAAQRTMESGAQALRARGEVVATGRLGASIDNLVADYYRQQATFDFATSRNLAFTGTQIQEQKRAAAATRGSRLAAEQPYLEQPVLDPMAPELRRMPSSRPYVLGALGSVTNAGLTAYEGVQKINRPLKDSTGRDAPGGITLKSKTQR
jgi:hypothetical protein